MRKAHYPAGPLHRSGLEYWYRERRTLIDFRRGPLGPYFDSFATALKKNDYYHTYGRSILGVCCQFNWYLIDRSITRANDITEDLIEPFLDAALSGIRSSSDHYTPRGSVRSRLRHLFAFLYETTVIPRPQPKARSEPYGWILDPFLSHLHEEHGVTPRTIDRHRELLRPFLDRLKEDGTRARLRALSATTIERHLREHLTSNPNNVRSLTSSLRVFLRYCVKHGHTLSDFSTLVPRQRTYRHASLPKGVEDEALERLLALMDRTTPQGARDYAVVLLLMAYGVRGFSAAELLLDDLDWERARIRFRARKGGKEVVMPLIDAVGEAIVQWLRHRFSPTPHREVFLSVRAPHGPLTGLAVCHLIRGYLTKAGVRTAGAGARTLRHSWAIRALAHDTPIKAISDALGHRHIDTTFIYAKADLKTLREVAMPWPGN